MVGSKMDDTISFICGSEEFMRFEPGGIIYIRGERVDDNHKVYAAMLKFLKGSGFLTTTEWDIAENVSIDDI
jgi:hypothetical protein